VVQGGRAPGGESGGKAPWSWMLFCFCVSKGSCKFAPLLIFAKVSKSHIEWMSYCLTMHLQRIYILSRRPYLTCAIRRFSLHTDRMQCTPCPKKYTPWLSSVRPSVRSFVCYHLVNVIFCKRMNRFQCKLTQIFKVVRLPKLDLKAWGRHRSRPSKSSR